MSRVLEGRNRATPQEAASFVDECDRIEQERERKLAELDAEFKAKKSALNKKLTDDQKAVLADAKKVGVAKGIIRGIVDGQKGIRKHTEALATAEERASGRVDELEADDRTYAVDIVKALGDDFAGFGLGAAAVQREGAAPDDTTAAIVAAASKEWEGADPAKH